MPKVKNPSDRNVIRFPVSQQSIERQLVLWIQELVLSNSQLVPTVKRLLRSYQLLRAGETVTDVEEVLWQVEWALKDVETASLHGLSLLRELNGR